jgi:hypothetical protein
MYLGGDGTPAGGWQIEEIGGSRYFIANSGEPGFIRGGGGDTRRLDADDEDLTDTIPGSEKQLRERRRKRVEGPAGRKSHAQGPDGIFEDSHAIPP